jgi:ATP-dependent DNA ligase
MLQRSGRAIGFVEPCLPSPAKAPPSGPDWRHEIRHDGFRILARLDVAGEPDHPQGPRFQQALSQVVGAVTALPARSCLIDGKVASCSVEVEDLKCGERGCYSPLIVRCPNAATR